MSHNKGHRATRTELTPREEVALGALSSENRWWTAIELAEAMEFAQEHLPYDDRFQTTSKSAGQTLGFLYDMGKVECDPPRGQPVRMVAGQHHRKWKIKEEDSNPTGEACAAQSQIAGPCDRGSGHPGDHHDAASNEWP